LWIPEDLFQKKLSQNREKVNHGNDNTTKAHLVNPVIAEISLFPISRFDEVLKASKQALFGRDFVMNQPGFSDCDGCCRPYWNCRHGFHRLSFFERLMSQWNFYLFNGGTS
jgi:hypothetical protein